MKAFEELVPTDAIDEAVEAALADLEPSEQELLVGENALKERLAERITAICPAGSEGQVLRAATRESRAHPGSLELRARIAGSGDGFDRLLARDLLCPEVLRQATRGVRIREEARAALRAARRAEFFRNAEVYDDRCEVALPRHVLGRRLDEIVETAAWTGGFDPRDIRHEFLKAYAIAATRAFAADQTKTCSLGLKIRGQDELIVAFSGATRDQAESLYCDGVPSRPRLALLVDEVDMSVVCHQALAWQALSAFRA
jgi:hypothetical protein